MFHSRHPLEVGHHVGLFQALLSCLDLCVLPWESRLELILSLSWKFSRQGIPNREPCEVQKEWIRPLALRLNGRVPGLKSPSSMVSTIACVWEMKIFPTELIWSLLSRLEKPRYMTKCCFMRRAGCTSSKASSAGSLVSISVSSMDKASIKVPWDSYHTTSPLSL